MQVLCVSLSKDNTTVPGCFLKEKKKTKTNSPVCVCGGGGMLLREMTRVWCSLGKIPSP